MKVVILYNADSGKGRGRASAHDLATRLAGDGHDAALVDILSGAPLDLGGADALLVAGGDGTLHHALDAAIAADVPIYHVPLGTENLFARQFDMSAAGARLAVGEGRASRIDAARCNGRTFVLMAGIGPDADVIHRLHAVRRGPISYLTYIRPTFATLRSFRTPRLTITADGRTIVQSRRGMLIVANSRQYGGRLDPAIRASMTDGLLDAVFFSARTRSAMLLWAILVRLRLHTRTRSLVYESAAEIRVTSDEPFPCQLDGEAAEPAATDVTLTVAPGALRILG